MHIDRDTERGDRDVEKEKERRQRERLRLEREKERTILHYFGSVITAYIITIFGVALIFMINLKKLTTISLSYSMRMFILNEK